jgi:hypothetical protein
MNNTIVRVHANRTASKALVTHCTMSVLVDYNASIQAAWYHTTVAPNFAVAKQYCFDDGCLFHAPQLGNNTFLIQHRVGIAYAPAEVRFEIFDG